MVHFEVPAENAKALADSLRGLESSGISVVIAQSAAPPAPAGARIVRLELVAPDRPGIVRELSTSLSERGVSIHELATELVDGGAGTGHTFKVQALLEVPQSLSNEALRASLDALAAQAATDISLGPR
jgi:glycine cleavage system regulatory protein